MPRLPRIANNGGLNKGPLQTNFNFNIMPNWIKNRVVFDGTKEDVAKIFAFIAGENAAIDFNSIIPSPIGIDKTVSGRCKEVDEKQWMWLLRYGYASWYEWRCDKWGTKWNACEINTEGASDDFIEFETAWSAPHPVIERLAECFPDVKICHFWADEDTAYNCGQREYRNGMLDCEHIPEGGSAEAYELAFFLRPYLEDEYELVDGIYRYKEEK